MSENVPQRPLGAKASELVASASQAVPPVRARTAALRAAGGTMLPMASGGAEGSALVEGLVGVLLRTSAVALIATLLLVLRGLREPPGR